MFDVFVCCWRQLKLQFPRIDNGFDRSMQIMSDSFSGDAIQEKNTFQIFLYGLLAGPQKLTYKARAGRCASADIVAISLVAEATDRKVIKQSVQIHLLIIFFRAGI
jgi:hypothetical protein